ncbi:MAG: DUF2975 domain-containing protein [Eubacterium sp.]|nr:DUF2975 domain-containing protein [Eubacterium sp.]
MKNSGIKSINTAGTIGYIISILLIICTITGMVVTAIGTAAAISVSNDSVEVTMNSNIDVKSTGDIYKKLSKFMSFGDFDLEKVGESDGAVVMTDNDEFSDVTVSKTDGGITVNAKTAPETYTAKRFIAALVSLFFYLGAITVAVKMLMILMKRLRKCETPFSEDIIKSMTRFANSLIPVVIIKYICSGLWSFLGSNTKIDFSLDIGLLLLVAVVYVLVMVFKYGAQLQRESDETL